MKQRLCIAVAGPMGLAGARLGSFGGGIAAPAPTGFAAWHCMDKQNHIERHLGLGGGRSG